MIVPFLPYSKLYTHYQSEVDEAMQAALKGGRMILQKEVEEFEANFAKFLGVKHVIGLNSGTDALLLALAAAGVGPGDEVITVSHTFIATIQVIHHLGATPVLVDVGEDGLMDMEKFYGAIKKKTKAIMPVHLSGDVADMNKLIEIIYDKYPSENQPMLIEDSAQAIGAERDGIKAGTKGFAGCFSFYPAKVLGTFGDAGALVTNDNAVAERVRSLRNHSDISKKPVDPGKQFEFGWNSRMDNVWAAVLNVKLKYLERDLAKRQKIAEYYNEALKNLPIILPVNRAGRIWQDYVIRTKDSETMEGAALEIVDWSDQETREALVRHLEKAGIGTLDTDLLPNHLYPGLGLDHFKLPNTERIVATSVRIPCNHFMTLDEAMYVAETIKKFYGA